MLLIKELKVLHLNFSDQKSFFLTLVPLALSISLSHASFENGRGKKANDNLNDEINAHKSHESAI